MHKRNVHYDLLFTINDPLNEGYSLSVSSLMQGYSTASLDSGNNVNATSSTLSGRIDTDTTDTLIDQIAGLTVTSASSVSDTTTSDLEHNFGSVTDLCEAGSFIGTQSFA